MSTVNMKGITTKIALRWMDESGIPDYTRFLNECAALEPEAVEATSETEMLRWYRDPLNHGLYLLAYMEGADGEEILVGVADYNRQPNSDHAWGWMHAHPAYRLRGVGNALYDGMAAHITEHNMPWARLTPSRHATLLIEFLERRGYTFERYFWEMQIPAEVEVKEKPELPEGFTVRSFVPGQDEELLMRVRNASFAEHSGSSQRTLEEIISVTTQPDFRPEGVFFAFEGEAIAGFCFAAIHPDECERRGEGVGHINLLGTMPEYRGRGVGRALLLTGVEYLRREVPVIELGVEGKNSNALALYKSVGFREYKGWANMIRGQGSDVRNQ